MKDQIKTMRKLQELVLIRDEHYHTGDGSKLDLLNSQIADLREQLVGQTAGVFDRLYKLTKNHVVIAAMTNGSCSACGMQVPIAQAQQVRLAQHLVTCSGCGRVLFAEDEDCVKNTAEKSEDIRTGVTRFSAQELMIHDLKASTREEAVAELATLMEKGKFISNAEAMIASALGRESILSTAMDRGVAFPHVRGVEGGGLTFALGVSKNGIDWDGKHKVNIVILSAIPVAVSSFYLRLLADLVQSFQKKDAMKNIIAADSEAALWKLLIKVTRSFVK
ncbi:MAG: PTS sugar transporter subunit IIA [Kiritimatiellae bacterium]|nr:PTS sugar transporter subunit IIA [Kiritimatiellia bacterium]